LIELLAIAAAASVQAASPSGGCEAIVDQLEVRRAIRSGQREAVVQAAELVSDCAGNEALLVYAAEAAWDEGDLESVSILTASTLRLISDRGCAWTPLAAQLAFTSGFSRLVRGDRAYSFYMHAARQADDHAGGLTRNQRFVAIEYSASFGTYPPDDVFAFGSPYIDRPYRTDEERCSDLPPLRIRYDAPVTDFVVGVFDVRTGRNGDIRDVRSLLTFPGQLSDDILRRLRRVRSHAIHFDDYVVLTFDPCLSGRFIAGDQPDVCLVEPTTDEVD